MPRSPTAPVARTEWTSLHPCGHGHPMGDFPLEDDQPRASSCVKWESETDATLKVARITYTGTASQYKEVAKK